MEHDLELEIASGGAPGVYMVAVDSPAGAAAGTVRLGVGGLLARRRELAASVLASAVTTRAGLSSALEGSVREVGEALFAAVFADRVYGRYTASVQEAARCGVPLRVVLGCSQCKHKSRHEPVVGPALVSTGVGDHRA